MSKQKLILISHDAMVYEDLQRLSQHPDVAYLLENGSTIKGLRTVYPSITYPVHSTIVTGAYPEKHGVWHNEIVTVGANKDVPWNWEAKSNKCYSIFQAAKEAGLTTAAVFWPVTGNHPYVDYLIPEYLPHGDETLAEGFRKMGSSEQVIKEIVEPNLPMVEGKLGHPYVDEFIIQCACDIVRKYNPDVILIHPAAVDNCRHKNGVFSEVLNDILDYSAKWTSMLMDAARSNGPLEDVNFVIMSDHGQVDLDGVMNLNAFLRDKGLITVNEAGEITDYVCWMRSTGVTAQFFLKNPDNEEDYARSLAALREMQAMPELGIKHVYTTRQIKDMEHLDGPFSFVIEGTGPIAYGNSWTGKLKQEFDLSDFRTGLATHGHHPDMGPQPIFVACGPAFKKGETVDRSKMVNIGPTLCKALGIGALKDADGTPVEEILK